MGVKLFLIEEKNYNGSEKSGNIIFDRSVILAALYFWHYFPGDL